MWCSLRTGRSSSRGVASTVSFEIKDSSGAMRSIRSKLASISGLSVARSIPCRTRFGQASAPDGSRVVRASYFPMVDNSAIAICYILSMHVISQKRVREATARFRLARGALLSWYRLVRTAAFENFAAKSAGIPGVDKVGGYFVFNVAGNHLRIVAAVHFNRRKVYIREILTHSEYDDEKSKR